MGGRPGLVVSQCRKRGQCRHLHDHKGKAIPWLFNLKYCIEIKVCVAKSLKRMKLNLKTLKLAHQSIMKNPHKQDGPIILSEQSCRIRSGYICRQLGQGLSGRMHFIRQASLWAAELPPSAESMRRSRRLNSFAHFIKGPPSDSPCLTPTCESQRLGTALRCSVNQRRTVRPPGRLCLL